jgi:hypothetical protein
MQRRLFRQLTATLNRSLAAERTVRPLPQPEPGQGGAGVAAKYMVLKRLMPLISQQAPREIAEAMRGQLEALNAQVSEAVRQSQDEGLQKGLSPAEQLRGEQLTHYAADVRRGKAAIDEIDILPSYRGRCVHDGWLSYTHYPGCRHALCGAHLLRELTYFKELSG